MYQDEYLDEYETDGDELEEEEEEEEYEEEKEDPKPSKEEVEYLALRQRLKESLRKQMKKENGVSFGKSHGKSQEKARNLPYDNYGSFFGPSQPVIAQRVIQESKSLLENQHLAARTSNPNHTSKNMPTSKITQARPAVRTPAPNAINEKALKAQKLRDMRDYSFLLSEDAEPPAPKKEPPPRSVSVPKSDARPAQLPSKNRVSASTLSKTVSNGRDGRRLIPANRPMQSKVVRPQMASGSKRPNMTSEDPRKQLSRNTVSGPGRPIGPKGLPSRMSDSKASISKTSSLSTMDKRASSVGVKKPVPGVQKAPLTKSHPSVQRHHLEQRRDPREPDKAKLHSKLPISSSRPQMKPPKQMAPRPPVKVERPKKRPSRPFEDDDEDDPHAMIRKMFRYNPANYHDDDDVSDMEAGFDDIQREENRSARIAREEDERELKLIEEEERRERMRKEAKRRKPSQR